MSIQWGELLHVLKVWSASIGIYGAITISVIGLALSIHTRISKDTRCNIKLLRKILS